MIRTRLAAPKAALNTPVEHNGLKAIFSVIGSEDLDEEEAMRQALALNECVFRSGCSGSGEDLYEDCDSMGCTRQYAGAQKNGSRGRGQSALRERPGELLDWHLAQLVGYLHTIAGPQQIACLYGLCLSNVLVDDLNRTTLKKPLSSAAKPVKRTFSSAPDSTKFTHLQKRPAARSDYTHGNGRTMDIARENQALASKLRNIDINGGVVRAATAPRPLKPQRLGVVQGAPVSSSTINRKKKQSLIDIENARIHARLQVRSPTVLSRDDPSFDKLELRELPLFTAPITILINVRVLLWSRLTRKIRFQYLFGLLRLQYVDWQQATPPFTQAAMTTKAGYTVGNAVGKPYTGLLLDLAGHGSSHPTLPTLDSDSF
eukprot:1177350-Prorocentrum_minimum.AAC.1